jgi:hypothetical protein
VDDYVKILGFTALGLWACHTVWHLYNRWDAEGTLDAILNCLRGGVEIDPELWCVDGTIIRAVKCASGGGKKNEEGEVDDHALGRSRGG